jgi:hypothetical protein
MQIVTGPAVIERLQADGYNVTAPQMPLSLLANDVARLPHHGRFRLEGTAVVVPRGRRRAGDPARRLRQFAARMGATTVEIASNHVAMVSHPDGALQLIEVAASAVPVAG